MAMTVTLIGWHGALPRDRVRAEERFAAALEHELGAGKVDAAYYDWLKCCSFIDEPDRKRRQGVATYAIARWEQAEAVARKVALDGLPGDGPDALFEIRRGD